MNCQEGIKRERERRRFNVWLFCVEMEEESIGGSECVRRCPSIIDICWANNDWLLKQNHFKQLHNEHRRFVLLSLFNWRFSVWWDVLVEYPMSCSVVVCPIFDLYCIEELFKLEFPCERVHTKQRLIQCSSTFSIKLFQLLQVNLDESFEGQWGSVADSAQRERQSIRRL